MVFVTHDQSEAMTLSDRVAVFNQGRIEQLASPQALYDAPANPFVASFVGDNNMIGASLEADVPASGLPTLTPVRTARGHRLHARSHAAHAMASQSAATLCVRPEFLQVAANRATLSTPNCVEATLLDLIHQGDHWRLVARLNEHEPGGAQEPLQWFAKISPGALPQGLVAGQNLCLGFRPEDAWVL
jgi:putative spermidine/putrescine transport system ATP-binding protein